MSKGNVYAIRDGGHAAAMLKAVIEQLPDPPRDRRAAGDLPDFLRAKIGKYAVPVVRMWLAQRRPRMVNAYRALPPWPDEE